MGRWDSVKSTFRSGVGEVRWILRLLVLAYFLYVVRTVRLQSPLLEVQFQRVREGVTQEYVTGPSGVFWCLFFVPESLVLFEVSRRSRKSALDKGVMLLNLRILRDQYKKYQEDPQSEGLLLVLLLPNPIRPSQKTETRTCCWCDWFQGWLDWIADVTSNSTS